MSLHFASISCFMLRIPSLSQFLRLRRLCSDESDFFEEEEQKEEDRCLVSLFCDDILDTKLNCSLGAARSLCLPPNNTIIDKL